MKIWHENHVYSIALNLKYSLRSCSPAHLDPVTNSSETRTRLRPFWSFVYCFKVMEDERMALIAIEDHPYIIDIWSKTITDIK